ncbi:DNA polymerase Y family protein [Streptomyces sp. cg28]|uniref:DNA polymerase Y family protein n=1 Tax=Streptomyces sp. cg28 TaxID=3403457 RepID=UPI003B2164F8
MARPALTAAAAGPGTGARDRAVLRVRFDLTGSDAQEVLYEQLLGLIEDITPVYQPHPADHSADLDVTGALRLFDRTLPEIAAMLQLRAVALHGVRATIGGGRSPMLAAMAAAAAPHGRTLVIAADDDAVTRFLRPRPLTDLTGIGPSTAKVLARYGITAIGHLTTTPAGTLARILTPHAARELAARAAGIDPRPVLRTALVRSTSAHRRFDRDELDPDAHRAVLLALADELGTRLRGQREVCRGLSITIRYADRTHTTRSRLLSEPSQHTPALTTLARTLYEQLGLQRARVRELTLRAEQLAPADSAHHQILLDPTDERARRVEGVVDAARAKFGDHVIQPTAAARRDARC